MDTNTQPTPTNGQDRERDYEIVVDVKAHYRVHIPVTSTSKKVAKRKVVDMSGFDVLDQYCQDEPDKVVCTIVRVETV